MTPKVYKAGEVCELLQVQPYVLRSWEKEFPGIGVQAKGPEESKSEWDLAKIVATIPGDQAFRPLHEGGCPPPAVAAPRSGVFWRTCQFIA